MVEILKKVVTNVLIALYQPFGFAIVFSILFTTVYMLANGKGCKVLVRQWIDLLKKSIKFRRLLGLSFYTAMILFQTLLNRVLWLNPASDVLGTWGLYNEKGEITTEVIENLMLFIPFTVLLLLNFKDKLLGRSVNFFTTIWYSIRIVFLFSLMIEMLQLLLRVGTFQLSDLFYNTLGGLVGGLGYWIGYKLHNGLKIRTDDLIQMGEPGIDKE